MGAYFARRLARIAQGRGEILATAACGRRFA
jgi:hypothetical protein